MSRGPANRTVLDTFTGGWEETGVSVDGGASCNRAVENTRTIYPTAHLCRAQEAKRTHLWPAVGNWKYEKTIAELTRCITAVLTPRDFGAPDSCCVALLLASRHPCPSQASRGLVGSERGRHNIQQLREPRLEDVGRPGLQHRRRQTWRRSHGACAAGRV